jgi:hypothetical protein
MRKEIRSSGDIQQEFRSSRGCKQEYRRRICFLEELPPELLNAVSFLLNS